MSFWCFWDCCAIFLYSGFLYSGSPTSISEEPGSKKSQTLLAGHIFTRKFSQMYPFSRIDRGHKVHCCQRPSDCPIVQECCHPIWWFVFQYIFPMKFCFPIGICKNNATTFSFTSRGSLPIRSELSAQEPIRRCVCYTFLEPCLLQIGLFKLQSSSKQTTAIKSLPLVCEGDRLRGWTPTIFVSKTNWE